MNSITSEELKNRLYLKATIDESMRLFPTAYMVNRSNKDWVKLGDYNFAPHTTFFLSQYALHRSDRYWKDPEKFKPERFLDAPMQKTFFPFGGGPRTCIGNHLAMAEALLFIGAIFKDLEPVSVSSKLGMKAELTASTDRPLLIEWKERKRP